MRRLVSGAPRRRLSLWLMVVVLLCPATSQAGIFGVPTGIDYATGIPSGSNPPGWLVLQGTDAGAGNGDTTSQIRLFIEVTGATLDVLVFDPGLSGARDISVDGNGRTTYTLFNPAGATLATVANLNNDNGSTASRLARFTPPCGAAPASCGFFALDTVSVNNVSFTGLSAGLYEFRITVPVATDDANFFGVDIRAATNGAHYNVYTTADTQDPDTAMVVGTGNQGGTPVANITQPVSFFPYVERGCSVQPSNLDMDVNTSIGAGASASVLDVQGATTAMGMSGDGDGDTASPPHVETTVTVEPVTVTNLDAINYGMYQLSNNTGSQQNVIQWRVADFTGWNDNPAANPRDPVNPIRTYLPNGYTIAGGVVTGTTAPVEPVLGTAARVVSGANPPAAGMTTRFNITSTVSNPTANTLTNVQITVAQPANVTYVAGSQGGFVDGIATVCTDGSGAGFRRCTFAALGPGSVASLNIEVDATPPAAGLFNLTGPPAALPNTTTTSSQYTPAFNSVLFPRTETLGPCCNLIINVGGGVVVTRASIRGLRVDPSGVVEFATGSQQNAAAFNVHAVDPRAPGGRVRLNAAPLAAPTPDSLTPVLYRLSTGPITASHLFIEEIDQRGRSRLMGPFAVGDERLRAAFERLEARLDRAEAPHGGSTRMALGMRAAGPARGGERAPRSGASRSGTALKIEVAAAGPVRVSVADLQRGGAPAGLPPGRLRLTNQGQDVPFTVETDGGGAPQALRFRAEALSTAYTGRNIYVLSWAGPAPGMAAPLTRTDDPLPAGFVRLEKNTIYLASAPEETDPWVWDLLFGDGSSWPYGYNPGAGDFDLPGLQDGAAGPVPVRLRVLGRTDHRHTVHAFVNGVAVGSLTFDGRIPAVLTGEVPAEVLRRYGNQLSIEYSAETASPDDYGLVYLGGLDMQAPVDPPSDPVVPTSIAPFDPSLPRWGSTDYLIVTHPLFREQAERIAALKGADGLGAVVVDVERAYDRFTAGIVEANAVQALIRDAAGRGHLRYVLLVGDDTFDNRDYAGMGAVSYVPSILGWDGEFGRVPSENHYADLDGDARPDVAIGRLPAQTAAEATLLADKVSRQRQSLRESAGRHLFAVDNQGPGDISFRGQAETVASILPPGNTVSWADVSDGVNAAHDALLQGLRAGAEALHFFGHANPEAWTDEGLLEVEDVAELLGSKESVVFTWACEAQWYQYIFGDTINESLVLLPTGGALASFGPAGITDAVLQEALFSRTYRHFLVDRLSLGEAVRRAKAETIAEVPSARPVVEGWNLLGDPALTLEGRAAPARRTRSGY